MFFSFVLFLYCLLLSGASFAGNQKLFQEKYFHVEREAPCGKLLTSEAGEDEPVLILVDRHLRASLIEIVSKIHGGEKSMGLPGVSKILELKVELLKLLNAHEIAAELGANKIDELTENLIDFFINNAISSDDPPDYVDMVFLGFLNVIDLQERLFEEVQNPRGFDLNTFTISEIVLSFKDSVPDAFVWYRILTDACQNRSNWDCEVANVNALSSDLFLSIRNLQLEDQEILLEAITNHRSMKKELMGSAKAEQRLFAVALGEEVGILSLSREGDDGEADDRDPGPSPQNLKPLLQPVMN